MPDDGPARPGFDANFLGQHVPPPSADQSVGTDLAVVDGSPVIPYTHFSLTLSHTRKLARWVAWNIDGSSLADEGSISRVGIGFKPDSRLPRQVQTLNTVYSRNRLDRGHIARRADLLWGDSTEAQAANADSFFLTNITPQMDNFNESTRQGVWGLLENALLDQVSLDRQRVSVMGGPILAPDDPPYRDVNVPREFWKILVYKMGGELRTRAYLVTQSLTGLQLLPIDAFATYLIPLDQLEQRTSLQFDPVLHQAQTQGLVETAPAPQLIESLADLSW